jgi:hypothetical protein
MDGFRLWTPETDPSLPQLLDAKVIMKNRMLIRLAIGMTLGTGAIYPCAWASDTSILAGPGLNQARMSHSVTRLPDGRVVVFGGHGPGFASLSSAEIYSPPNNSWTVVPMQSPHDVHAFVQLADGRLMVAGGSSSLGIPAYSQIELFDPVAGTFSAMGNMVRFRAASGGAQLNGGKVLLAGAWWTHNDANTYGELYDPVAGTSIGTGPLALPRSGAVVFPTSDGNAVVVGGMHYTGGNILPTPELYSVAENAFTKVSDELFAGDPGWMVSPSFGPAHVVQDFRMTDGRFLCSMYRLGATVTEQGLFVFNPVTKSFSRFETHPALPDSSLESLAFPPQLDLDGNKAYFLVLVPNVFPQKAVLRTVDLATGATVVLPGTIELPGDYVPSGATFTRLKDGRFLLAGGATPGSGNFGALPNSFLITAGSSAPAVAIALHAAVTVSGDIGSTYLVEYALAISPEQWQPLKTVILTNVLERVYDPTPIPTLANRFYRARRVP